MNRTTDLRIQAVAWMDAPGPDGARIPLGYAATNKWLESPQWFDEVRNLPVAYVRAQRPSLQVGLQVEFFAPQAFTLSAYSCSQDPSSPLPPGSPVVGPYSMALDDPHERFVTTAPIPLNAPLPDAIGCHTLK